MSQAAKTEQQLAREYGQAVGFGAALFVLAQVFVAGFAAHANQPAVYTLERSLVNLAAGGGAMLDPVVMRLIPMFVATYLAALIAFAGGLVLCWHAGRLAAIAAGTPRVGATAGRRVMAVASAVWVVLSLLVYVVFQLDGTFSWLVGTLGATVAAPSPPVNGIAYSAQPNAAYIAAQVAAFLIQALIGVLIAIVLGGIIGRLGAQRITTTGIQPPAPPAPPGPPASQMQ